MKALDDSAVDVFVAMIDGLGLGEHRDFGGPFKVRVTVHPEELALFRLVAYAPLDGGTAAPVLTVFFAAGRPAEGSQRRLSLYAVGVAEGECLAFPSRTPSGEIRVSQSASAKHAAIGNQLLWLIEYELGISRGRRRN